MRDHDVDHLQHRRLRLTDRQSPDRVAVKVHLGESLSAEDAKIVFCAPLNDAEYGAARLLAKGALRTLRPSERKAHRTLGLLMRARQPHALVELHLDVRAQKPLDFHRTLGRQFVPRSVDMRLEGHAALAKLAQLGEAHHLKAAGIGEDRMGPVHEFVQAPERRDPLGPRSQHQVIGVGEHDVVAELPHRIRVHGLDGGGGADRHESRSADHAARHGDGADARCAVGRLDGEGEFGAHRLSSGEVARVARVKRHASPYE